MNLPTGEMCEKRPRIKGIPKFMIVDQTPLFLWQWWNELEWHARRIVKDYLGHPVYMVQINLKRDVFKALIDAWDHRNNVFHLSNLEMTPTLRELASFMGVRFNRQGSDLRNKMSIVPKNMDEIKFLKLLKINQIKIERLEKGWIFMKFLFNGFGREEGFKKY